MSRVSHYAAVWISLLVIVVYFLSYYHLGYLYSKFGADFAALMGLAFMSVATLPVAIRAFKNGIRTDQDRFIFSYWLIWTIAFSHRIWIVFLALMKNNDPTSYDYWYYGPCSGFIAIGFGLAAGFGGIAPFSSELPVPRRELIIFTIAAGFSGIIAGIAIGIFAVSGWAF